MAFGARPELVRTFPHGYHRSLVGRLSAPKVSVIYAGTCFNRDSDSRDVRAYCVDQSGNIYTVNFAYGPHYHADSEAIDDHLYSRIASVLRSLIEHRWKSDDSSWFSWRNDY